MNRLREQLDRNLGVTRARTMSATNARRAAGIRSVFTPRVVNNLNRRRSSGGSGG